MKSEAAVQSRVRLQADQNGGVLFRNNSGVFHAVDPDTGKTIFVRYGLCNDSKEVNAKIKSSDLIGIRPVKITPDMVGKTFGLFVARECKREGLRYSGSEDQVGQKKFIDIVNGHGGDAAFVTMDGEQIILGIGE